MEKNKRKSIPAAVRTAVWNTYIGEHYGTARCFTNCGNSISQANFQCGHVVSDKDGGQATVDNLRPICQRCNTSMGSMNMNQFIAQWGFKRGWLTKEKMFVFQLVIFGLLAANLARSCGCQTENTSWWSW